MLNWVCKNENPLLDWKNIEHKGHLNRSNGDNLVHFVRLSMENIMNNPVIGVVMCRNRLKGHATQTLQEKYLNAIIHENATAEDAYSLYMAK